LRGPAATAIKDFIGGERLRRIWRAVSHDVDQPLDCFGAMLPRERVDLLGDLWASTGIAGLALCKTGIALLSFFTDQSVI
jgi:hypothetical protein